MPGKEVECLIDRLKASGFLALTGAGAPPPPALALRVPAARPAPLTPPPSAAHPAQDHFQAHVPSKSAAQLKAQRAQLMQTLPQGAGVDDKLLDVATSLRLVENISLLSNSRDNGFEGVNMYVDDEGSIRDAPRNLRATEIAHCCGKQIDVKGDAFLARVMDNGDDFARLDLTLGEVSSSAGWVAAARAQAERRGRADTGQAVVHRMQRQAAAAAAAPPPAAAAAAAVRELTPSEAAKDAGNAAFKRGAWADAAQHYTEALQAEPGMAAALNNRAMALLKLERWAEAEADCGAVLEGEAVNVKALLRRAAAREGQGRREEARADLEAALRAQPQNKEAAARLAALQ